MKRDYVFTSCVGLLLLTLIIGIFVRGKKEVSTIENRVLEDFPQFSADGLLDNSYQSNLEVALTDQILFGDALKTIYNNMKNRNFDIVVSALKGIENKDLNLAGETKDDVFIDKEPIEEPVEAIIDEVDTTPQPRNLTFETSVTPRSGGFFQTDDSGHLIIPKRTPADARKLFEPKANNYNNLVKNYPELSYHLYYIETDVDMDFINGSIDHELAKGFFQMLDPSINTGALYINGPEEYKRYFYKTDHHWDTEGQLKGYEGMIQLLLGKDEELLDIETGFVEGAGYNGSRSRQIWCKEIILRRTVF